jgi:hypothetical protein
MLSGDLPAIVIIDNCDKLTINDFKNNRELDLSCYNIVSQEWYRHGQLHRDGDLPAVVDDRVGKKWYQHGRLHRPESTNSKNRKYWRDCTDYSNYIYDINVLPSIIRADGTQEWYIKGALERDHDLPAIVRADGTQEWYQCNVRHRENNKPAVISPNGTKQWYICGVCYKTDPSVKLDMDNLLL